MNQKMPPDLERHTRKKKTKRGQGTVRSLRKFKNAVKIALSILVGSMLSQTSRAACHASCATCFGTAADECLSCSGGNVLQEYQCVGSCDASLGYNLDSADNRCKRYIDCAIECKTCWGTNSDNCMSCMPGFVLQGFQCIAACDTASGFTLDARDQRCKKTIHDIDYPCAPSKFNKNANAVAESSCLFCSPGRSCDTFALSASSSDCLPGFYCTNQSTLRSPVAIYASDYVASPDPATPDAGIPNFFIKTSAAGTITGDICSAGNICTSAATKEEPCQAGLYCPEPYMSALDTNLQCMKGFYCSGGSQTATPGNPYNGHVLGTAANGGNICDPGNYCTVGSTIKAQCSSGKYLPFYMADEEADCISCPYGKYCPNSGMSDLSDAAAVASSTGITTYDCEAGYYCTGGATNARQLPCPQDFACAAGTYSPSACAPGTFTASMRSATCTTCNPGFTCHGKGTQQVCGGSEWCINDVITQCLPGKYHSSLTGESSISSCLDCPVGQACKQPNQQTNCDGGFLCSGQAQTERPNDSSEKGSVCGPGVFCSIGAATASDCTGGLYCADWGLSNPSGQCLPGHYCGVQATTPTQTICPAGKWCGLATTTPNDCPAGTFNEGTGATQQSDCKPCPAGVVCTSLGLQYPPVYPDCATSAPPTCPVQICPVGKFCPLRAVGSAAASIQNCPKGSQCPGGTRSYEVCFAGTYSDVEGLAACKLCPKGFYCDGSDPQSSGVQCPRGRYCPDGTKFADEYPCPAGTYSSALGLEKAADCTPCTKGFYCQFLGQTAVITPLVQRYHGNDQAGLMIPNPYLCPQGFYCQEGTADAVPCPDGKWTSDKGAASQSDCIPCKRGFFCKFTTMYADVDFKTWKSVNPSFTLAQLIAGYSEISIYYGACQNGYICLEGATSPTPTSQQTDGGYPCPVGHFCQAGDIVEMPCFPGTYNNAVQQSACTPCPAQTYCPDFAMTAPSNCLAGSFCDGVDGSGNPEGEIYPAPCPPGTYNSPAQSSSVAQCLQCPDQQYCMFPGQLTPEDNCASGFICKTGQDRPGPYVTTSDGLTTSGKCPEGAFCEVGATSMTACLAGTYMDREGASNCLGCPPGKYCTGGKNNVNCDAGYYCEANSVIARPTDGIQGNVCPINKFCPAGSGDPLPCRDGTRQPLTGQGQCDNCDKGYVCRNGGEMTLCASYHFCEGNITYPFGQLCLNGFYGDADKTGFDRPENCTACPATEFCTAGRIVDKCAAGYICLTEAGNHRPNSTDLKDKAYPCPLGFWCGEGQQKPVQCPITTFTFEEAAKQESECTTCQMGYYCDYELNRPYECGPGTYCPFASYEPQLCPKGTYQPQNRTGTEMGCLPCKGGYNCRDKGIGNLFTYGDDYLCPEGFYCPRGYDIDPAPCIAGSYVDRIPSESTKLSFTDAFSGVNTRINDISDCSLCPEGYFCPIGTGNRFTNPCTPGHICPAGSGEMQLCPPGFFCEGTGSNKKVQEICPEGHYCAIGTEKPVPCGPENVCPEGSSSPTSRGMLPEDCLPGTYLHVDRCLPCEPGFVCDKHTAQKYPISLAEEGGYECPKGSYCPRGTVTSTIKKCPIGTYQLYTRGEDINSCLPCPDGSATNVEGSEVCTICGRGSTNNKQRNKCECIGQFRTWQETTNSCVCMKGYNPPFTTEEQQTSTQDLDCIPILTPICLFNEFINEFNRCQSKSSCDTDPLCSGLGGYYDETQEKCMCKSLSEEPEDFCDVVCENVSLKAYVTGEGQIRLKRGSLVKTFDKDEFSDALFLDGLTCDKDECLIVSTKNIDGKIISSSEASQDFIEFYRLRVDKNYESPYTEQSTSRRFLNSTEAIEERQQIEKDLRNEFDSSNLHGLEDAITEKLALRHLQSGPVLIEQSIQCIRPYDAVSFEVTDVHFPVYVKDSLYNTDPNYDYGTFSLLATKLQNAKLLITSFMVSFTYEGVFVFGDYSAPQTPQTVILVTSDESKCAGKSRYPLTSNNLQKLGIAPIEPQMRQFDFWYHFISPFFILLAFGFVYVQNGIEKRIEAMELERRIQRDQVTKTMKKYFRKKADKFDKVKYLGDMYELIKANLAEIKRKIAENDALTEKENAPNINKLLKDKHNLKLELDGSGGWNDINFSMDRAREMLKNLRFQDGRSLAEQLDAFLIQQQLEKEEKRVEALQAQNQQRKKQFGDSEDSDSFLSEKLSDNDTDEFQENALEGDKDAEKGEFEPDVINVDLADDLLQQRANLKVRRQEFIDSLDENLSPEDRQAMINKYDETLAAIERNLQREQEDNDARLKAKLQARRRKTNLAKKQAETKIGDKKAEISVLQSNLDDVMLSKDKLEDKGINTKKHKAERDAEYQERMKEFDVDRDEKIKIIRNDYTDRIKKSKNPQEKEKLLDEMGRRLKTVEESLAEERKRQEASLMKILRARQKKQNQLEIKGKRKEGQKIQDQIDDLSKAMEIEKAQMYADAGQAATGVINQGIAQRKTKIADALESKFKGLHTNLNEREKEDIEIHKTQLQIDKERELTGADAEIEQQLDAETEKGMLNSEKEALMKKIRENTDPSMQQALLEEMARLERLIKAAQDQEGLMADRALEEKRKRRQELLNLKKMKIDAKQIQDVTKKEIEIMQDKFDNQCDEMDRAFENSLDPQIRGVLGDPDMGKEQVLIIVNEAHDDLLARKLKFLMSKQFDDLTRYLGGLQNQVAMEHMIRCREIDMKFERDKDAAIKAGLPQQELEETLQKLTAAKNLEKGLSQQKMDKDRIEAESELREKLEEDFCQQKKDLVSDGNRKKRKKLVDMMDRMPNQVTVQEVGKKLLRKIEQTVEQEMDEANKTKEANLEKARLKIIAENDEELQELQGNLNKVIKKEEERLESQLNQRRDQILEMKRQNLEERLKMVGDMSEVQKMELLQQYEREFHQLDKAIRDEKEKQLSNMRAAMLTRRIAREKQRRKEEDEKNAALERERVQKMQAGEAKAYNRLKTKLLGGGTIKPNQTEVVAEDDKLRARLAAWQRQVEEARGTRGGDEGDIWTLEQKRVAEKEEKIRLRKEKELAKLEKDKNVDFTVQELYKRIVKVEKISERIKDSGILVEQVLGEHGSNLLKRLKSSQSGHSTLY